MLITLARRPHVRKLLACLTAAVAFTVAGCSSQPTKTAQAPAPVSRGLAASDGVFRPTGGNPLAASDGLGRQVFVEQTSFAAFFKQANQAFAAAERDESIRVANLKQQDELASDNKAGSSTVADVPVPLD